MIKTNIMISMFIVCIIIIIIIIIIRPHEADFYLPPQKMSRKGRDSGDGSGNYGSEDYIARVPYHVT